MAKFKDIELSFEVAPGVDKTGTVTLKQVEYPEQKVVTGKGEITGKKAGDILQATELFDFTGGASADDIASVTGDGVTWNSEQKTLKINEEAADED